MQLETQMKFRKIARVTSLLALVLAASSARSVSGANPEDGSRTPQGEKGEQAERVASSEPTRFVLVPSGPKAVVTNAEGVVLGNIQDHVVETKSGRVLQVVLETSGQGVAKRLTAIPFGQFVWEGAAGKLVLPMTPEQISALPEFDRKRLEQPVEAAEAAAGKALAVREILASHLQGREVKAGEQLIGRLTELVLEPERGTLALVLVGQPTVDAPRDSAQLVLPWQALTRDEDGAFLVAKQPSELSAAPKLAKDELRELERAEFLKTIYDFYGVELPRPSQD